MSEIKMEQASPEVARRKMGAAADGARRTTGTAALPVYKWMQPWDPAELACLDAARCSECRALPPRHHAGCTALPVPVPGTELHSCAYILGSLGCRLTCGLPPRALELRDWLDAAYPHIDSAGVPRITDAA
ncbi:MAG TPA: hypothetical protein VHZ03_38240 [Trebonia sp.]|jgi:hypothetical protein|nr:hypothetical protein [Trebonia sp.]